MCERIDEDKQSGRRSRDQISDQFGELDALKISEFLRIETRYLFSTVFPVFGAKLIRTLFSKSNKLYCRVC